MANSTVANIEVSQGAVTGAIFWAPPGTALPTDATTALAAAFKNLGYVGADGITPARDVSTDNVTDMNGANLRTIQTDFSKSYSAPMLEVRNEDLARSVFGTANVTITAATTTAGRRIAVVDKGRVADKGVMVIETFDGLAKQRRVLPIAQPTSVEEGALVGTAVQQFTLTWSCYPDSTGAYEYKYDDDGVFATA
jgi:hypothetical protein